MAKTVQSRATLGIKARVSAPTPHLLHVFSTFVPAGPEMRTVHMIGAFGGAYRHSIVAIDGRTDARERLAKNAPVRILESPPKAGSIATIRRLRAMIRAERPDLVLSYNWGAFDAVLAAKSLGFAHSIHHEDGFNADEAVEFKKRRVLARRWFLPGVRRVIVPSKRLLGIATETWKLAPSLVQYIPNGIRLDRFAAHDGRPELRDALKIPRTALVVGYVGHLRPEKNPLRLLKACARVDREIDMHVLVLGDGPERAAMEELASKTASLYGRVHFAGHQPETRDYYRAMDVFAISSDTEQMPVALLEAMASALPVVSTDVGDVRDMLPKAQDEFVVPLGEHETAWPLAEKLTEMLRDTPKRTDLGAQNRREVERRFTFDAMLAAYHDAYAAAMRA
jgi:glycosyltransferase involved in cell wall biosynthesis